jgi:GMP reductase
MRIERDVKLDYSDVLFRPKRSTLSSRKEVTLHRSYQFKHSGYQWTGVPIVAANMDGVGTFEMAEALNRMDLFTAVKKSYTPAQIHEWLNNSADKHTLVQNIAVSTGVTDSDDQRLEEILVISEPASIRAIVFFCLMPVPPGIETEKALLRTAERLLAVS